MYKDYPHDAVVENLLIECKVRTVELDAKGRRHFPLDLEWLNGVVKDAERAGFEGAVLVFNATGSQNPLFLAPLDLILDLMEKVKKQQE